jgi:hypothetical protein
MRWGAGRSYLLLVQSKTEVFRMSAYVVDKRHIDFLVSAALQAYPPGQPGSTHRLSWWRVDGSGEYAGWREINPNAEHMTDDGQMLVSENVASVHHRYPDDDADAGELPGPCDAYYMGPYVFEDPRREVTPGAVFRAIDCLDYQSCEHDEWRSSEAYAFLGALRKAWCDRVADAEHATWEVV